MRKTLTRRQVAVRAPNCSDFASGQNREISFDVADCSNGPAQTHTSCLDGVGSSASDDRPPLSREREFERRLQREAISEVQQFAAEMHDGLGQELAGISLLIAALRRVPQARHSDIQGPLAKIGGLMIQAMVSCRRVSEGFGAFLVRRHGLTAALLHFASQFDDENTQVKFRGRNIPPLWLDEISAHYLFAIGREAIFDAFRHGRAKTILVTCDYADNSIRVVVEDDGVGLIESPRRDQAVGRSIMEYRARSIGAALTFTNALSGGVRVECSVMCAPKDT